MSTAHIDNATNKGVTLYCRMTVELRAKVQREAESRGESASMVVREAIREYFERKLLCASRSAPNSGMNENIGGTGVQMAATTDAALQEEDCLRGPGSSLEPNVSPQRCQPEMAIKFELGGTQHGQEQGNVKQGSSEKVRFRVSPYSRQFTIRKRGDRPDAPWYFVSIVRGKRFHHSLKTTDRKVAILRVRALVLPILDAF